MDISSKGNLSVPPSFLPEGFQIKNLDLESPRKEEQEEEVLQIKNLDLLYASSGASAKLDNGGVCRNDETEKTHGSSSSLGEDDTSSCSTTSVHEDRLDDNMDDDDDDEEEEDDVFDDDDSCSSLDGMIPSMASQSLVDNNSGSSGPSIHFMGRDFPVDELSLSLSQSSQKVIQDSSVFSRRSSRRSRRANNMSMSCQEHLSGRWATLEQEQEPQALSATRKSSRRNRRSSTTSAEQTEDSMDNSMVASLRRVSTATISSLSRRVSSSSPRIMASESEHFGSTRRSSALPESPIRTKPKMGSQSEHFGSSRRSSSTVSMPQSRAASTPTGYLSSLVGKVNISLGRETAAEAAAAAKDQRWNDQLDRWGYSNHDVLCVVQDDHVFRKLQRDLREHKAVTNGTIRQKIHVFVHNTRTKQLQHQLKQERRKEKRQLRKHVSSSQDGSDHSTNNRRQKSPRQERASQTQS